MQINRNVVTLAAVTAGSLAAGGVGGYLFAKNKFRKIADEEIESVKENYNVLKKEGPYENPKSAAEALGVDVELEPAGFDEAYFPPEEDLPGIEVTMVVDEEDGSIVSIDANVEQPEEVRRKINKYNDRVNDANYGKVTIPESVTGNVFDRPWEEVRNPEAPYVISFPSFADDPEFDNYSKLSLVYWEADDIVTDEGESPINNVAELIGVETLTQFGVGSNDPNIVYVRNEKLEVDLEVSKDERSYSEVILGVKPDRPSNKPRRMRPEDDGQ